jgi:hypothetical protein
MSTKSTLAHHQTAGDEPGWHLYEETFEAGVIYLELRGVQVEMHTTRDGADVVLRLPLETVRQLGMHTIVPPERWESATDPDKARYPLVNTERLQRTRVIRAAARISGSHELAVEWFENELLEVFGSRTPQTLVAEGRTEELLAYIQSLDAGFLG